MVSRTSLRSVSSNSSKLSADSHSSQSTSSTAGRLSSDTSTRPPSMFTRCICSVLTRKFRSLPQFGQVKFTEGSFEFRSYEMVGADATQIVPKMAVCREFRPNVVDFCPHAGLGAHERRRVARLDAPLYLQLVPCTWWQ